MIKLISLDLDGTLLQSNRKIGDSTLEDLRKAHRKGVKVIIATGRNYEALPDWIKNLDFFEYIITSNGGQIRNLSNDKIVYENHITGDKVKEIHEFLQNNNYMVEAFTSGKGYISQKDYNNIVEGLIPYRLIEYVVKTRNPVSCIYDFIIENQHRIENINIFAPSYEEKLVLMDQIKEIGGITVTTSMDENVEIGGADSSKAKALEYLGELLNIKRRQMIAMGDGHNDIDMIKFAGIGVAMGNGHDELKQAADYITDTNDNNGVGIALRFFEII